MATEENKFMGISFAVDAEEIAEEIKRVASESISSAESERRIKES